MAKWLNWISWLRASDVRSSRTALIIAWITLLLWLGGVILATSRHEYWRDEVRPWSEARTATSLTDLVRTAQYDGHPPLWYAVLYLGNVITGSRLVLPVASIAVALAAVIIFLFWSPFELWIKGLFLFGVLPFYEYSVMARNYGLSMLLFFLFAALYRRRRSHPLVLGFLLALSTNANVHSIVPAGLLAGVWVWDTAKETGSLLRATRWLTPALGIVLAGVALSLWATFPRPETVLTDPSAINTSSLIKATWSSTLHAGQVFRALTPDYPVGVFGLLLFVCLIGLALRRHLLLAACIGTIGLGVIFSLVYPGYLRHQGILLLFLIVLYWLATDTLVSTSQSDQIDGAPKSVPHVLFRLGKHFALPAILLGSLLASRVVVSDLRHEISSSKAFGSFLAASPRYRQAILVPDPDYSLESLPYYADNLIYLPRENRFGSYVSWTTAARASMNLDELLSTASDLFRRHGRPVLIVLGHRNIEDQPTGENNFLYNKTFTWTVTERERLERMTRMVARFDQALSERYLVYELR